MAKILNWKGKIDKNELNEVIKVLKNNGVVIFPTDTVYGIGCNCFSKEAINRIFEIKSRSSEKPINVLTDKLEKISKVAENINDKEKNIIEKYMPGPLTIILDKRKEVPYILTANLNTIGVRIPNNKIALEILKNIDVPLATTSVNISGQIPGIELKDFENEFSEKVDIIIDGGKCDIGVPSTIVKVNNNMEVEVLRKGSINL